MEKLKEHPMEMRIKVENQYGNFRNFPDCPVSRELIKLTGRKTFNDADITALLEAGFAITKTEESPR